MFRNLEGLIGWTVGALDGIAGRVKDFVIDDAGWVIRYLAVERGSRTPHGEMLVSSASFLRPEGPGGCFPVKVTCGQIESAPGIDAAHALSRAGGVPPGRYYGWPIYGEAVEGLPPAGAEARTAIGERVAAGERLKTLRELERYEVLADDGEIGGISDLIIDDIDWKVYYLVVDASSIVPRKKVALAATWADRVNAATREVTLELSLKKIKDGPAYDVSRPIDRQFEERLYRYYGMPPYWRR